MSFRSKLSEHADNWIQKGIISEGQKAAMLEDIQQESSAGRLFRIVAVIGVLFIGGGVLLMISSNWEAIPKLVKLVLILAMPIVATWGGYHLSYVKDEYDRIGNALIFLGALLVGASLALLGQLYNLDGSAGSLLAWWFVLTLPYTYIFRYRMFGILSTALLYLSIFYILVEDRLARNLEDVFGMNEEMIVMWTFIIIPAAVVALGEAIRRTGEQTHREVIRVVEVISVEVIFFILFIGTLVEGELALFGDSFPSVIVQNALLLAAVFGAMWIAIKRGNDFLRHSSFLWLGAYMIAKYIAWFWDMMDTGLFFVIFGLFLLGLVYGYVRFTKYTNQLKEEVRQETLTETDQTYGG